MYLPSCKPCEDCLTGSDLYLEVSLVREMVSAVGMFIGGCESLAVHVHDSLQWV